MSDLAIELRNLIESVPSLNMVATETDVGMPVIAVEGEPVFRCRTNELGSAYTNLIIHLGKMLPAILETLESRPEPGSISSLGGPLAQSQPHAATADHVQGLIASALALHPELQPKSSLWAKLVYAAVAPFLDCKAVDLQANKSLA